MYLNITDCDSGQTKIADKISNSYFEFLCLRVDDKQTKVLIIKSNLDEYWNAGCLDKMRVIWKHVKHVPTQKCPSITWFQTGAPGGPRVDVLLFLLLRNAWSPNKKTTYGSVLPAHINSETKHYFNWIHLIESGHQCKIANGNYPWKQVLHARETRQLISVRRLLPSTDKDKL